MSLSIENLYFSYNSAPVLKGVSFSADYGELIYILGPNGVGKSTLFRCILGQLKSSRGNILISGKSISDYSIAELAKEVAYIPQSYKPTFNYSVLQTVTMGRTVYMPLFASPSDSDYEKSREVLEKLGISDLAERGVTEISGGERQLVLIARALVQDAKILIMDEPTSNLDYGNQLRIQNKMRHLSEEGMLVIQSSHNPQNALQFADRVIAMYDGMNVASGKPGEVINPNLMEQLYALKVEVRDGQLIPFLT
jgi:iron complex transport system ATP-binding protein